MTSYFPAYPTSVIVEYYDDVTALDWVDISDYVVGDIKANYGLGGWRPDQRVATLGSLSLTLNNKGKQFTPMGGDGVRGLATLAGWTRGARIRVRVIYDAIERVLWTGRILAIDSDDKNWGEERARLTAIDWMDIPARFPMKRAAIAIDQTLSSALTLLLARLSVQPESTDFDTGTTLFATVFDNVKNKSMGIGELQKLANSEPGYIYLKGDGTLRAEGATARVGTRALDKVAIEPDAINLLLKEDGDYLLKEDGELIILNEAALEDVQLYGTAEKYNILMDDGAIFNAAIVRAYPTVTDTSLKVLYTLGKPIKIGAGLTKRFSAHYTDPNGNAQISGTNMQTPAATTDYTANTLSSGAGTDKTADMTVTATYYGDTVEYSITNGATVPVWLTKLQARGYGIYYGNSIESTIENTASQQAYGYSALQFDMRYQRDTEAGETFGASIIEEYKAPKSRITNMSFLANLNKFQLSAFLSLTVGCLILLLEDRSAINNHYYITDVNFTIKQGGIINASYGLKQNDSYLSGALQPFALEARGLAYQDCIEYAVTHALDASLKRSYSIWLKRSSSQTGAFDWDIFFTERAITPPSVGNVDAGKDLRIKKNSDDLRFVVAAVGVLDGFYEHTGTTLTDGAWHHIVWTYDGAQLGTVGYKPTLYIDGAAKSVTILDQPTGAAEQAYGEQFMIGGTHYVFMSEYATPLATIFDARAYDRELSAAEVTTLYNGGTPDVLLVPDGVAFQGPALPSDLGPIPYLDGNALTPSDRILENAYRLVGVPFGAPIIRSAP